MFGSVDAKKDDRRVGASVTIPGQVGYGPAGLGPGVGPAGAVVGPGFGPYGPGIDAIGVFPPYGGCPVYPPVPPPPIGFGPIVYDDRIIRRDRDRDRDVAISASISSGQVVAPGTVVTVALGSLNFTDGGATLSGNSLVLPRRGNYTITASITLTRGPGAGTNVVTLSVVGGILGGGILESVTLGPDETATLSGSLIVQAPNHDTHVSFQVANSVGGDSVVIGSGIVGAKL